MPNKDVILYLDGSAPPPVVVVTEADTAWTFRFTVMYQNSIYAPTVNNVILAGHKPDGNAFAFLGSKSGNVFQVGCNVQMTAVPGDVFATLHLLGGGNTAIPFILRVQPGAAGTDPVASVSALPAYTTILNRIGNFPPDLARYVSDWLEENISGGETLAVDSTFSIEGAAAPAKATGDRLKALEDASIETDDTLSIEGAAADAAAVGARFETVEDAMFVTLTEEQTNARIGGAPVNYNWGVFFKDISISDLSFLPSFPDGASGTYSWALYKTADGEPADYGKTLTQVDSGSAEVGQALTFASFSNKNVIVLTDAPSLGFDERSVNGFKAAKFCLFENGKISARNYGLACGTFSYTKKVAIAELFDTSEERTCFYKKSASFYGDSLTEANNWYTKGYYAWLQENLLLSSLSNYGVSGYRISSVITKMQSIEDTSDMIFVMVGVNDEGTGTTLGEMGDNTVDTVYGGFDVLARLMRQKYPDRFLCMITPHFQTKYTNTKGITSFEIAKAMKEVCEKYCIPCYDNRVFSQLYSGNLDTFTGDGCHWNNSGHRLLGNNLSKWLLGNYGWFYFPLNINNLQFSTLEQNMVTIESGTATVNNGSLSVVASPAFAIVTFADAVAVKGTYTRTLWVVYAKNSDGSYSCVELFSGTGYRFKPGTTANISAAITITKNSTPDTGSEIILALDGDKMNVLSADGTTVHTEISGANIIGFFASTGSNAGNFLSEMEVAF